MTIQYLTFTLPSRSQNIAQHLLHHMTYAPAKFEVQQFTWFRRCIYKKIQYLSFDLGSRSHEHVAQHSLHHVTYAPAMFEVATCTSKG